MVSTPGFAESRNASQRPARSGASTSSTRGRFLSAGAAVRTSGFTPDTVAMSAARSRAAIFTTSGALAGRTMGAAAPSATRGNPDAGAVSIRSTAPGRRPEKPDVTRTAARNTDGFLIGIASGKELAIIEPRFCAATLQPLWAIRGRPSCNAGRSRGRRSDRE